jgi:hypothetical protein
MTSESFLSLVFTRPKHFSPEILSCIVGLADPLDSIEFALLAKAELVRNLEAIVLLIPSTQNRNKFIERLPIILIFLDSHNMVGLNRAFGE